MFHLHDKFHTNTSNISSNQKLQTMYFCTTGIFFHMLQKHYHTSFQDLKVCGDSITPTAQCYKIKGYGFGVSCRFCEHRWVGSNTEIAGPHRDTALFLFLFICVHLIQVRAYCLLDIEHVIISVHNTKQYKFSSGPKLTEIYSYHNTVLAYRACEYT